MCSQFDGLAISVSDNHIRTIRLNVPKKKNAIANQMYFDIVKALKEAAQDEQTRITVITGRPTKWSKMSLKLILCPFKALETSFRAETTSAISVPS